MKKIKEFLLALLEGIQASKEYRASRYKNPL